MRKSILRFLAALSLLAAGSVQAADVAYFGIKGGLMMPDAGGYDDTVNIGVVAGIPLSDLKRSGAGIDGTISLEGEFTMSLIEGDVNVGGLTGDWDVWTLGAYGAYRSPTMGNNLYFKAKAGIVHSDVDANLGALRGSGSDTDLALGLGLGFKLAGGSNLEIELTLLDDMDFLSVAYHF